MSDAETSWLRTVLGDTQMQLEELQRRGDWLAFCAEIYVGVELDDVGGASSSLVKALESYRQLRPKQ